jgi:hypothetical protein
VEFGDDLAGLEEGRSASFDRSDRAAALAAKNVARLWRNTDLDFTFPNRTPRPAEMSAFLLSWSVSKDSSCCGKTGSERKGAFIALALSSAARTTVVIARCGELATLMLFRSVELRFDSTSILSGAKLISIGITGGCGASVRKVCSREGR